MSRTSPCRSIATMLRFTGWVWWASAQAAAIKAIQLLSQRVGGSGGLILLDGQGRVGYARNSSAMAHAFITETMDEVFAGV